MLCFKSRVMWDRLVHESETYSCPHRFNIISMMTSRLLEKKKAMVNTAAICNFTPLGFCFCQLRILFFGRSDVIFSHADLAHQGQKIVLIMLIYILIVRQVIFTHNQVKEVVEFWNFFFDTKCRSNSCCGGESYGGESYTIFFFLTW